MYLYLSVSFIQMLKAFTPVITMCALFVTRLETPTYKVRERVCGGGGEKARGGGGGRFGDGGGGGRVVVGQGFEGNVLWWCVGGGV